MQEAKRLHVDGEKVCNSEKGAILQQEKCFLKKFEIQIFHSDEHFYAQQP